MRSQEKSQKSLWSKLKNLLRGEGNPPPSNENTDPKDSHSKRKKDSETEPILAEKSSKSHSEQDKSHSEQDISSKIFEKCSSVINRNALKKIFKKVETCALTDKERITYFRDNSKGKLRLWWSGLGIKPQKWEDLKLWLVEDLKSLETIEKRGDLYCGRGFPSF